MTIRTVLVDDEPLARRRIRRLLKAERDVEVVAECGDGTAAVEIIETLEPDLVFLDVQMPEMDGFQVLAALPPGLRPTVIFVTAYDEHALRAFEVQALDYLLKPFTPERFGEAVERARAALRSPRRRQAERLAVLLREIRPAPRHLERLLVDTGGKATFIRTSRIDWIEAEGNYARLHVGATSYLVRITMARIEAKLDPRQFLRVHRSTIVNLDSVAEVHPWSHGDSLLILRDGTKLMLSRTHRERAREIWGRSS